MDADEFEELKRQVRMQGRWLRWSMTAWVALLMGWCLHPAQAGSAPVGQELSVRRLALVDSHGTERVVLATEHSDVRINGKVYHRRSPAAGLILQNAKGDEVGGIAMLDDGTASFTLDGYSKSGANERASLYTLPDGSSGVLVKDAEGKVRARMEVDARQNTVVELSGQDEHPVLRGSVTPAGKATWTPPGE